MKAKLLALGLVALVLCGLFLLRPLYQVKVYARKIAALSPAQVNARVGELDRFVVPPDGTPVQDIEAVYGHLSLVNSSRFSEVTKGRSGEFLWWELLPMPGEDYARAALNASLQNGTTLHNGVNHLCVTKGRRQGELSSDAQTMQRRQELQADLDQENRGVLLDLMLIRDKYGRALKDASWNRLP